MEINIKIRLVYLLLILTVVATGLCFSDEYETSELLDMDLESLMEVQVVFSSSRIEHKITESSVPVTIVTSEDIHNSGLMNIEDILRFYAGMDILRLNQTHYAVGVRGLHDVISDRVLTLINGRTADSPFFGGSEFFRMPLLLEDIERIEIIRGPGGAVWGANAFTGVINIITKQPGSDPGWFASSTVNEYGDTYTHLRWMGQDDLWKWRVSVGYEDRTDSDSAGAGEMTTSRPDLSALSGFDDYKAHDFIRNMRVDAELSYEMTEDTLLTFGSAYSGIQKGDYEFLGYFPRETAWYRTSRNFAKIEHTFDDDSTGYLQWTGNYNASLQPSLYERYSLENELEVQYNTVVDRHTIALGGNIRFTHLDAIQISSESLKPLGDPFDEIMGGIFVIDRYEATDRLTIESQFRTDWYSETRQDWSARLTSLYALDEQRDHMLRFSAAKAFRAPYLILRNDTSSRLYHPGFGFHLLNINTPPGSLDNEETWSLEAGYTGILAPGLTFKTDAYYQKYEQLIAYDNNNSVPLIYTARNIDGLTSWGVETELAIENETSQLAVWYAYNDFQEDVSDQLIRSYAPAKHKSGMRFRHRFGKGYTFIADYRYTDTTPVIGDTTIFPVGANHRLDLKISKSIFEGDGELMIGVSDLMNDTNDPVHSIGTISSYTTPGRTWFARLQFKF